MTEAATETTAAENTEAGTQTTTETDNTEAVTTEQPTTATKVEELPDWAQREIRTARDDAAKARTAKNEAADAARNELIQKLGKELGLVQGDEAPTVEQLAKELTDQKQTTDQTAAALREARAELVVWRNHSDLGVDAAAVTDSRAFERALAELDPSSDSFEEDVKKAAQAAAEANPKLKAQAQAAGRSGADLTGGSGEGAVTQEQFKNMSGAERNKLAQTNPTLYSQLSSQL